jgi:hypothetical protein
MRRRSPSPGFQWCSVAELKRRLAALRVDYSHCLDREDMLSLLEQRLSGSAPGSSEEGAGGDEARRKRKLGAPPISNFHGAPGPSSLPASPSPGGGFAAFSPWPSTGAGPDAAHRDKRRRLASDAGDATSSAPDAGALARGARRGNKRARGDVWRDAARPASTGAGPAAAERAGPRDDGAAGGAARGAARPDATGPDARVPPSPSASPLMKRHRSRPSMAASPGLGPSWFEGLEQLSVE